MKKNTLLLGAHISVAGGYHKAIERAISIGCTTVQIFTKSNRQWKAKPITDQEADLFKTTFEASGLHSVVVHASYLINLASSNTHVRTQSVKALGEELHRCHQLDIPYLVLHPGSNSEVSREEALTLVADNLNAVIRDLPSTNTTMILLESMAGQGSTLCNTFEELAFVLKHITSKSRVGVCVDTCHIFAAGYDLRTHKTYEETWKKFDTLVGLKHLKVIHCNDSKKELGSRVDRHEVIGKGCLTDSSFALLFNDERFFAVPKILEIPKEDLSTDLACMEHIVTLLEPKTKNKLTIMVGEKDEGKKKVTE